ncbi:phage minor head protein [Phocoenobacter skyensis]|uniref:Phage minor head protein n=1 Tax=Phocoenobacter skyensis TaxID=97481 RepID=A0ABT9JKS2_9PAST|nr:phage minor head protein [Pasteurella skyensis]MDP8079524.1 phage minor head protein [Pasteurella skyensis]MDP8085396.1 phage minor head protein [Pasteurella skyensis]
MTTANFAIGLEPKEAVAFLKQKRAFLDQFDEKELMSSARANAYRIANISSLEMTKDIYDSLAKAKQNGLSFNSWKKQMMNEFERKGWITVVKQKRKGKKSQLLLADPKTGEIFGTPRRLALIYRVNMQEAMSASRYQKYMQSIDKRPYWQYSAILDYRTRASHAQVHGVVYRYDDPFWATFYPPNGFNCRCTVKALSERDLKRNNLIVSKSEGKLVEVERSRTARYRDIDKTIGYKFPDDSIMITDRGFDYNAGRTVYKPNLDNYPEKLAHQFAKAEMKGGEFKWAFNQIETAFNTLQKNRTAKKISTQDMIAVRNKLNRNFKFASGVLTTENKKLVNSGTATIWLSDDTLIKQFNSRKGQSFNIETYANLPDLINSPDRLFRVTEKNKEKLYLVKRINNSWYLTVIKYLKQSNEMFAESFRKTNIKEIAMFDAKYETLK